VSADSWAVCPRCRARGTIGLRGNTFREDWELGLNDPEVWGADEEGQPPVIILNYRGKCTDCGLSIKVNERFPLEGMDPERNEPQPDLRQMRAWVVIPAGWWVLAPNNVWFEVRKTENQGRIQQVEMRNQDGGGGTWDRPARSEVTCCPGTVASPVTAAFGSLEAALGARVEIIEDQVD